MEQRHIKSGKSGQLHPSHDQFRLKDFYQIDKKIFDFFVQRVRSGKENSMSTKEDPVVDYDACYDLVKRKTLPLVNPKPITLNQNQITAISYFFERAIETGMIGEYNFLDLIENSMKMCVTIDGNNFVQIYSFKLDPFTGGEVTLQEVVEKAQLVCATANVDQPFMCLDLVYISTLLQDGYNLKPSTKIKVQFNST